MKEVKAFLIQGDGSLLQVTLFQDGDLYANHAGVRYVVNRAQKAQLTNCGELNGDAVGLVNPLWPTQQPVFWLPKKQ